ncbi:MAG: DNA repair protein RadA [Alphaproteobacteria bacterium]|nr:DNA repair protein RadA [Alphaproteobacteria bacterium]
MAKPLTQFVCQQCGSVHTKWSGQCGQCRAWHSLVEETVVASSKLTSSTSKSSQNKLEFLSLDGHTIELPRMNSGSSEFDRVLGGGFVKGSAILLGGDPGIGKSTLLLQTVVLLGMQGFKTAYISGEESVNQIRMRARRLGLNHANVQLAASTDVGDIVKAMKSADAPDLIVIDSIQTMYVDEIGSSPGTVSQVRGAAHELITVAKQKNIVLVLVGHVTKDGQIAGPKLLEHMVDTVLYFEGERGHQFRILRSVKNRFGAANEIGVFEMAEVGLVEVTNPSQIFLSNRDGDCSGSVVFAGLEGTRPVLTEIQALVAPSHLATPRRAVVGWDPNRLAMIIAVLATRYGLAIADKEVYLNVAGGLKVGEPAADLAVAIALVSSLASIPLPSNTVVFGEVGLSGEVRMVGQADTRLREAMKLGFTDAIVPGKVKVQEKGLNLKLINHVKEISRLFADTNSRHVKSEQSVH